MGMYHNRLHVADIRAMKARGEKIAMLYVSTHDEAAAAAAGIHILSIEGRFFDAEMREAAGDCFVQVGLPYGGWGSFAGRPLATAEDYLRVAYHYATLGGDAYYCAASYEIRKTLCDNHVPVGGHIGLIPPYIDLGVLDIKDAGIRRVVQRSGAAYGFGPFGRRAAIHRARREAYPTREP